MSLQTDLQWLIQPIAPGQPCGENLEDTARLAAFDEFRVFGHSTALDPQPDWIELKDRSLEALSSSKDLRLLAYLATAVLRTDGIEAFSNTLTAAAEWLDAYWAQTYPQIDEDAILRRNALNCFADQMAIIDGLRRVPLVESRQHGRFSLRDIDIVAGIQPGNSADTRRDEAQIDAAFASASLDDLRRLEQNASAAVGALRRIDTRMREQCGSDAAPAFEALLAQLTRMQRVLAAQLGTRGNGHVAVHESSPAVPDSGSRPALPGAVRSREEAIQAMETIATFFRQHEPSSPVPLFLDRAKRLVSKDFIEVLADIAPEAVAHARAAGGLRAE